MIYIFVPFLADYDQNHMQMISLKKLLGCSQFQIIQIFVIVPGVVPYSFLTKRAARLCVLSMSFYLFLNVRIPCATSINSSCGLTKARQACCFTFSGHLRKFFLIKPRDLLALPIIAAIQITGYLNSKVFVVINSFQGFSVDDALHSISRFFGTRIVDRACFSHVFKLGIILNE